MKPQLFQIGDLCTVYGEPAIIGGSGKDLFKSGSTSEYTIYCLQNEKIVNCIAWIDSELIELVDSTNRSKYLDMIRKYNSNESGAPIGMSNDAAKFLGFTSIHTYNSAIKGTVGEIKVV